MTDTAYAKNIYTHVTVSTFITPLDLIILLYDGVVENLHKAIFYMNQNDVSLKIYHISKAMAIIKELLESMDMEAGGEIALNLRNLYIFMLRELTLANARNDTTRVEYIKRLLKDLRVAWREVQ